MYYSEQILLSQFVPQILITFNSKRQYHHHNFQEWSFLYEVCPEGIQPCNVKNTDIYWRRCKIEKTLYIGKWCLSPLQSRHLGTWHSSLSCHQLPHCNFLNLIDSQKSLPFKGDFCLGGKVRSFRLPNLGCRGAESLGWFDVSPKTLHKIWCMRGLIVVMKLPITSCP